MNFFTFSHTEFSVNNTLPFSFLFVVVLFFCGKSNNNFTHVLVTTITSGLLKQQKLQQRGSAERILEKLQVTNILCNVSTSNYTNNNCHS